MLADGFRRKYTTIPFAIYRNRNMTECSLFSHYHKETEVIVVVEGTMEFFIGAERYEMNAGDVIVIPPYSIHRSNLSAGTYHECVCFDLSILWDDSLRRDLEKGVLTVKSHLSSNLPYTQLIYKCVRDAIEAYDNRYQGWEMEVIGNLSVMFGKLRSESFFIKSGQADTDQSFVKRSMDYIREHFSEQITSTTAAEHLYLNNSYFCRLFKKSFGCCFSEYLTNYRIEQSKILLNTTEDSVSDIAIKCGFNGFSYFSKMFKLSAKISPSEYRKLNSASI